MVLDDAGNLIMEKNLSEYGYRVIPPVIVDLDHDDMNEIIIKTSIPGDTYMLVLNSKGDKISGWRAHQVENVGSSVECYPVVANFDDDEELEIVLPIWYNQGAESYTYIRVYNMDGTLLPGWESFYIPDLIFTPVSVDIDHDGYDEIIFNDWNGYIHIVDRVGQFLLSKKYVAAHGTPAVGDLNNGGHLDIVISLVSAWDAGSLVALDIGGNELFNITVDSASRFSPTIGDIDGDQYPDVVLASAREVTAVNYKGEVRPGVPLKSSRSDRAPSPTIAAIDNDGKIEIVASTDSAPNFEQSVIYVWDVEAPYDERNMPWRMFQHDAGHSGRYVENGHLQPPADINLKRELNRSLFRKEAFHTITWQANFRNRRFEVTEYRVYRKYAEEGDDQYRLIASVPAGTLQYEDGYLDDDRNYVYVLTSVAKGEGESLRSLPVSHIDL
jgi:hypothetical protein